MFFLKIFFLIGQMCHSKAALFGTDGSDALTNFIAEIASKIYSKTHTTANFIHSTEESNNYQLMDMKDESIKKVFKLSKIVLRIESVENIQYVKTRLKTCMIIFIDTLASFRRLYERIQPHIFKFHGYYTIVLTDGVFERAEEILSLLWKKQIYNVVIIYESEKQVRAVSFNPFNPVKCNDTSPFKLNVSVDHLDLFPKKLQNLNSCPLKVAVSQNIPFVMLDVNKQNIVGRDIELVKALSNALNFTLELQFNPDPNYSGTLSTNSNASGSIKDLIESSSDMIVGDFFLNSDRLIFLAASSPYYNSKIVFLVPLGTRLESIEKLLQPFSQTVWITLLSAALVMIMIFLWLNIQCAKLFDDIFIGRSAFISVFAIVFGVSLPTYPLKAFGRVIWISLVMFCLVLQAVYQGSMYKYLQTDGRHKEVQSIEEMMKLDFKFTVANSINDFMRFHPTIQRR